MVVSIRAACPEDADQLRGLRVRNNGQKWTKLAERVIHDLGDVLEDGDVTVEVLVAVDGYRIVGVIAHMLDTGEKDDEPMQRIITLGVVHDRRREGIASALKAEVINTCISRGIVALVSEVHDQNHAMIKVNEQFFVETARDPEDTDYLITVVRLPTY